MTIKLEATGYQRRRDGGIRAVVRVVAADADGGAGGLLFADTLRLDDARARAAFARELRERLDGRCPDMAALERALLTLLAEAEAALSRPDPAPRPDRSARDGVRVDQYLVTPDGFYLVKPREGAGGPLEEYIRLSTFTATVREEVVLDDGAEARRIYVVHGQAGDRPLPPARVPAEEFAGMRWLAPAWGLDARILPGQNRAGYVADAILAGSQDAVRRSVYAHLGWRRVAGRWVYLHGGGGIGAAGAVPDVAVELDGALARFRLPPPPDGEDLRRAVRRAWQFWDVAVPEVSAVFLGAAYAAPLAEWLHPDFSVWAYGHTGRLKTSYVACVCAHFGDFDQKHVPASWEDTANSLEKVAFLAKDTLLLIDDYRPAADRGEAAELRRKAARLVRDAGNRSGRRRMRSDLSLRPAYSPRGIIVSTAEERISGDSAVARRWEIAFEPGAVAPAGLAAYQADTEPLRQAMAAYLRHLAATVDQDDGRAVQAVLRAARGQAPAGLGGHLRHPTTWATLLAGWLLFCDFAVTCRAVSEGEATARVTAVRAALTAAAAAQERAAQETRTELVFLRTLGDLLAAGKAHLCAPDGGAPGDARGWGWDTDALTPRPLGEKLGWVSHTAIDLIPTAAQRAVHRALGEAGVPWDVSPHTLHRALAQAGFLTTSGKGGSGASTSGDRHTVLVRVEGRVQRVLRLARARVEAVWGRATLGDADADADADRNAGDTGSAAGETP